MKRHALINSMTKSSYSNAGVVLALVVATVLAVSACGGMEPGSAGTLEPAQPALDIDADEPVLVDPTFEPAHLHPNTNAAIDPALLRRVTEKNVSDLSGLRPEYKKKQILELCNGGALKVADERVQQQLEGSFTLELWVKTRDESDQRIVQAQGLEIGIRDQRVQASIAGQELVGWKVVANEWYHVALVVTGQKLALFVNGMQFDRKEVGEADWKRPQGALVMGGEGSEQSFCGKLDSVRLTHGRLYVADFQPKTELQKMDASVFLYSFDNQKSANTVYDAGYWKVNATMDGEAEVVPGSV